MADAQSRQDKARGEPLLQAEQDEVELSRAHPYRLLASLLAAPPDDERLAALAAIEGDETPLGLALTELATAARTHDAGGIAREYQDLFIGVGRGELVPFGSFYMTGFLHEKPLALLRDDLAELGITRTAGTHEPEDHIAALCDVMAGLIEGAFDAEGRAAELRRQQRFFTLHLEPWARRFMADLEAARSGSFYKAVGRLGTTWFEIEARAFSLAAPAAA